MYYLIITVRIWGSAKDLQVLYKMYLGIVLLNDKSLRQLFGNFSPHWLGQYPQAIDSPHSQTLSILEHALFALEKVLRIYISKSSQVMLMLLVLDHTLRRPQRNVSGMPTIHSVFGESPRQLPCLPFCTGSHL